jgi:hypothetical protein
MEEALKFSARWWGEVVPGIRIMLGDRWRSHARARVAGDVLREAARGASWG